jgi:hypothetical protein
MIQLKCFGNGTTIDKNHDNFNATNTFDETHNENIANSNEDSFVRYNHL